MLFSVMLVALSGAATAQDLPSYMAPIGGRTTSSAAETATKNVLALNTMMFQLYDTSGADFPQELDGQSSDHPRPLLRRGRPVHPLPARQATARRAAGADPLSAYEVGRALYHGTVGSGNALS